MPEARGTWMRHTRHHSQGHGTTFELPQGNQVGDALALARDSCGQCPFTVVLMPRSMVLMAACAVSLRVKVSDEQRTGSTSVVSCVCVCPHKVTRALSGVYQGWGVCWACTQAPASRPRSCTWVVAKVEWLIVSSFDPCTCGRCEL